MMIVCISTKETNCTTIRGISRIYSDNQVQRHANASLNLVSVYSIVNA